MGLRNYLFLILSFLVAMKMGWNCTQNVVLQPADIFSELESLWEVEHINNMEPFSYHLQIDK
ncbi:MAG: hypothetical protein KDD40_08615 [Bdellovibrionales bacterium]|nr:hypothetical protein [Bdellovibrionales bacterium]